MYVASATHSIINKVLIIPANETVVDSTVSSSVSHRKFEVFLLKSEAADFFYYFKHIKVSSCFYYLQYKICNTLAVDFSSRKISMNIKLTNLLCNSVAQFVPYFQPRDHVCCAVPVKTASKLMFNAILSSKNLMFL